MFYDVSKMILALLEEFKNDPDYNPEQDYLEKTLRYVEAVVMSQKKTNGKY